MGTGAETPTLRQLVASRWQIPTLLVSLSLLVMGLLRASAAPVAPRPADLSEQVEALLASGRVSAAATFLGGLLDDPRLPKSQRGVVHALLARCFLRAERVRTTHSATNAVRALEHAHEARAAGQTLSDADELALVSAMEWAGRYEEALEAWERLLASGRAPDADAVRRRLADWMVEGRVKAEPAALDELTAAVLSDGSARPANVAWALEQRVERLLTAGKVKAARDLVARTRPRLERTPQRDAAAYLEATCALEAGQAVEAERLLRELRSRWQPRDELWAKVSCLLGQLSNRADRPQMGLNYFDDVLKAFRAGPIREVCLLGRAESLLALERYAEAADALEPVVALLAARKRDRPSGVSRAAVRTFVRTAAQSLEGRELGRFAADAARFFAMSAKLLGPDDRIEAAFLYERLGDLRAGVARARLRSNPAAAREAARAAAAAYEQLIEVDSGNEPQVTRAVEKAVAVLDAAREPARSVALLQRFVSMFPNGAATASALRQIGEGLRAQGEFRAATEQYREVLARFGRTVDATQSLVGLAECLAELGGAARDEAVTLLTAFIDAPPERESLVTPQAPEYRTALLLLARLLYQHGDWELAIRRLEDAIAFYPDEPRRVELLFLLGQSYRRSGEALEGALATSRPAGKPIGDAESARRVARAAEAFEQVIAALAPLNESSLSPADRTRLRSAYMARMDCLFSVGRYAEALAAATDALWRYEREPECVSAAVRLAQCQARLGRAEDARRTLERARWLLERVPDAAFSSQRGQASRAAWKELLDLTLRTEFSS